MSWITETAGRKLARFLSKPVQQSNLVTTISQEQLIETLQPADVLLVEGNTRLSVPIKYLTQSTWSHAAMYIGNALPLLPGESWQLPLTWQGLKSLYILKIRRIFLWFVFFC